MMTEAETNLERNLINLNSNLKETASRLGISIKEDFDSSNFHAEVVKALSEKIDNSQFNLEKTVHNIYRKYENTTFTGDKKYLGELFLVIFFNDKHNLWPRLISAHDRTEAAMNVAQIEVNAAQAARKAAQNQKEAKAKAARKVNAQPRKADNWSLPPITGQQNGFNHNVVDVKQSTRQSNPENHNPVYVVNGNAMDKKIPWTRGMARPTSQPVYPQPVQQTTAEPVNPQPVQKAIEPVNPQPVQKVTEPTNSKKAPQINNWFAESSPPPPDPESPSPTPLFERRTYKANVQGERTGNTEQYKLLTRSQSFSKPINRSQNLPPRPSSAGKYISQLGGVGETNENQELTIFEELNIYPLSSTGGTKSFTIIEPLTHTDFAPNDNLVCSIKVYLENLIKVCNRQDRKDKISYVLNEVTQYKLLKNESGKVFQLEFR